MIDMNTHKFRFVATVMAAAIALAAIGVVITTHFNGGGSNGAAFAAPAPKTDAPAQSSDARALADQLSGLFETASNKIGPSVVPIFAEQSAEVGGNEQLRQYFGDDFFRRFFGTPDFGEGGKQTVHSMGSGVIVTKDGYILTNNHVVSGADKLTVKLDDGTKVDAKVIGTDPQTDVAVIKIDAKDLPAAELGNSDDVHVGQWVIAVGNPFQLLHSVTAGIISATGRSSVGLAAYEDFIQTDASINPGNSGGALADLDGKVIGINTAITSPSGASAGIGFAIPINMARHVMDALISKGKVSRGYLALVPQDLDENLAKAMGTDAKGGALVGDVMADGPAAKAGIKRGDIITDFDGKKVKDSNDLRKQVADEAPSTKVDMKLLRNGHPMTVSVKLGERPANPGNPSEPSSGDEKSELDKGLGLGLQDLSPDVASQLGYQKQDGALVATVGPGSPAEDAGLRRGDLIQEVDNKPVDSASACARAIKKAGKNDSVLLLVRRGATTFYAALKMS
jgi:serine protease Do